MYFVCMYTYVYLDAWKDQRKPLGDPVVGTLLKLLCYLTKDESYLVPYHR